jgi:HD-GYP domain-containing protein (c-di-GMP phosphodiesterase class II)
MSEITPPAPLSDTLEEFYQDFAETHLACEHALIGLEQNSHDLALVQRLQDTVNELKNRLIYAGMRDLSALMQGIEDCLGALLRGSLQHDMLLNDVLLLAMDRTQVLVEAKVTGRPWGLDPQTVNRVGSLLATLPGSVPAMRDAMLRDAHRSLDPDAYADEAEAGAAESTHASLPVVAELTSDPVVTAPPVTARAPVSSASELNVPDSGPAAATTSVSTALRAVRERTAPDRTPAGSARPLVPEEEESLEVILDHFGIAVDDDLRLFIGICAPIEARSMYWNNCTARILELCLAMNEQAGHPVEPAQLAAAVLLHDIGMAFLPVEILHKRKRLETHELALLQAHPAQGAALLSTMSRWQVAAEAVAQHHERMDGRGYPRGLGKDDICIGARIISIADTFEARTHERAYSTRVKRPFIRAVLEINSCSGTQFDPAWVAIFNDVARYLEYRN